MKNNEKYGINGKLIIAIEPTPIINENKNNIKVGKNLSIFIYKNNINTIKNNNIKITANIKLINIIA